MFNENHIHICRYDVNNEISGSACTTVWEPLILTNRLHFYYSLQIKNIITTCCDLLQLGKSELSLIGRQHYYGIIYPIVWDNYRLQYNDFRENLIISLIM